jgi:hypothetical protein
LSAFEKELSRREDNDRVPNLYQRNRIFKRKPTGPAVVRGRRISHELVSATSLTLLHLWPRRVR